MIAVGGRLPALLCVLGVAFLLLEGCYGSAEHESAKARDRKSKSKDLTDNKDSNGDNEIVAALVNISWGLSGEEAVEWNMLIEELNETSNNASFTSDEILVFCAAKIKTLFLKFPDLREQFLYFQIGSWGDFDGLFQVSIWINADFSQSVLIEVNGESELELAILKFEASISDVNEKAGLEMLRFEISETLNDASLSFSDKMANLSVTFQSFFSMHAAWEDDVRGIDIDGFGPIGALIDVADQHFRIKHFADLFVVDAGQSDCRLVVDLTSEVNNVKYGFSRSEQSALLDFINNIRVLIAGNASLSISAKIQAVVYQYTQLMLTSSFLKFKLREFAIGVEFGFGTFGELIDAYDFGDRFAVTSPPPTTQAPTTTTAMQGNCATVTSVVQISSGNWTIFYNSSATYLNNHVGIQATNWRPYLTKCHNSCIMNSTLTGNDMGKIQCIASIIKTYIGTDTTRSSFLYAIQIGVWGTYKQLQTCGGF